MSKPNIWTYRETCVMKTCGGMSEIASRSLAHTNLQGEANSMGRNSYHIRHKTTPTPSSVPSSLKPDYTNEGELSKKLFKGTSLERSIPDILLERRKSANVNTLMVHDADASEGSPCSYVVMSVVSMWILDRSRKAGKT